MRPTSTSARRTIAWRLGVCWAGALFVPIVSRGPDDVFVDVAGELADLTGQLGVQLQFLHLLDEVVIGLRLLEGGLPVLSDHHEGGQEDRLERDRQCQRRPRIPLDHEHPEPECQGMEVHELHRARERSDAVRESELELRGALGVQPDDYRVLRWEYGHVPGSSQSNGDQCLEAPSRPDEPTSSDPGDSTAFEVALATGIRDHL